MRKWALLGLVAVLSLGVSLAFSNSESISWQQWAEHYQVGNRPPTITWEEIPFIDFIPGFGPKTIGTLQDNLPITSEAQLRAIDRIGEKKATMLLALYNLERSATALPTPIEKPVEAIAVGRVIRVIDGDTIVVTIVTLYDPSETTIRFAGGINAPDLHQPGRREAKDLVRELCLVDSLVWLDVDDLRPRDRYGRLLAVVYVKIDGVWVNISAELLRWGLVTYPQHNWFRFIGFISEFNPFEWLVDNYPHVRSGPAPWLPQ